MTAGMQAGWLAVTHVKFWLEALQNNLTCVGWLTGETPRAESTNICWQELTTFDGPFDLASQWDAAGSSKVTDVPCDKATFVPEKIFLKEELSLVFV